MFRGTDFLPATDALSAGLVAVVGFLQCHPMLLGFAGVIFDALRQSLTAPMRGHE